MSAQRPSHQESIDVFGSDQRDDERPSDAPGPSRALEGLAQEMEMERIALSEAASGVVRDELVMMIARGVRIPLERLDMVEAYVTDLELEGRLRRVGEVIVLARSDDGDLLDQDMDGPEFLDAYRRRYDTSRDGVGR